MQIENTQNDGHLTITPDGRIDTITTNEFLSTVMTLIDENKPASLTLDFSEVVYISSVGLRALIEIQKKMNSLGSTEIINVQPVVQTVFDITGFQNVLTIRKQEKDS